MKPIFKKLSWKHKNNRVLYYAINFTRQLFPSKIFQSISERKMSTLKDFDTDYIRKRVNYYNKLETNTSLSDNVKSLENFKLKEIMTIKEQLDYKFIPCIEGHDVASNLKWVMSSNSLAVMPVPKYETWYMEGTLIANCHYVLIKEDYSDLEERMEYYINHAAEALEIIKNAHRYIEQFKIKQREDLISLLILEKYFYKTSQKTISEP